MYNSFLFYPILHIQTENDHFSSYSKILFLPCLGYYGMVSVMTNFLNSNIIIY